MNLLTVILSLGGYTMKTFDIYNTEYSSVHFIGIGGVSMSGLATILLDKGISVSGSDMNDSETVKKLRDKGAEIFLGHSEDNIKSPDLVIYTDAISPHNPEFKKALDENILCVDRGTFLGQLMRVYEDSIAVAGTHGKTTTTSMLTVLLNDTELNPTILLGGSLEQIKGNVKIGDKKLLITEACEYKGNVLKFHSTVGILLNVDNDHLDYFTGIEQIIDTFKGFVALIPEDGHLIVNIDDENAMKAAEDAKCNVVTFGKSEDAKYRISDIKVNPDFTSTYKLTIDGDKSYTVNLNVIGEHNILDSAAAITASHCCGIEMDYLLDKIQEYTGTKRRLERKGTCNGFAIIDDYAHHPTEIQASLKAAKHLGANSVWCIFQPHTYSRSISLIEDFCNSFYDADHVIIADIFAAREQNWGNVHAKDFVERLQANEVDALYFESFDQIEEHIMNNASEGDIVLTMGAGNIVEVGENIINKC